MLKMVQLIQDQERVWLIDTYYVLMMYNQRLLLAVCFCLEWIPLASARIIAVLYIHYCQGCSNTLTGYIYIYICRMITVLYQYICLLMHMNIHHDIKGC